jgi:hypothetical protein
MDVRATGLTNDRNFRLAFPPPAWQSEMLNVLFFNIWPNEGAEEGPQGYPPSPRLQRGRRDKLT